MSWFKTAVDGQEMHQSLGWWLVASNTCHHYVENIIYSTQFFQKKRKNILNFFKSLVLPPYHTKRSIRIFSKVAIFHKLEFGFDCKICFLGLQPHSPLFFCLALIELLKWIKAIIEIFSTLMLQLSCLWPWLKVTRLIQDLWLRLSIVFGTTVLSFWCLYLSCDNFSTNHYCIQFAATCSFSCTSYIYTFLDDN